MVKCVGCYSLAVNFFLYCGSQNQSSLLTPSKPSPPPASSAVAAPPSTFPSTHAAPLGSKKDTDVYVEFVPLSDRARSSLGAHASPPAAVFHTRVPAASTHTSPSPTDVRAPTPPGGAHQGASSLAKDWPVYEKRQMPPCFADASATKRFTGAPPSVVAPVTTAQDVGRARSPLTASP